MNIYMHRMILHLRQNIKMLILKIHVHVDYWSSLDNNITMLHVLLNLLTSSSGHQLQGSVLENCPMGLMKAVLRHWNLVISPNNNVPEFFVLVTTKHWSYQTLFPLQLLSFWLEALKPCRLHSSSCQKNSICITRNSLC